MRFLNTLKQHLEADTPLTIITPFGTATGKVVSLDEKEGTFVFQSPSPKPFSLYLVDVLFVVEG